MKKTPMQQVKDNFGDRASLVAELAKLVDKQHGDSSTDDVKSRLMGLSNAKLLRLYRVEQVVREGYGDRAKLEAAIVDARVKAGATADDDFKVKLATYTKAQLVDMTNMRVGDQKIRTVAGVKPPPKVKTGSVEPPKKKATKKKAEKTKAVTASKTTQKTKTKTTKSKARKTKSKR